jgi:hypothetical protein
MEIADRPGGKGICRINGRFGTALEWRERGGILSHGWNTEKNTDYFRIAE